jgi:hypothetical protein
VHIDTVTLVEFTWVIEPKGLVMVLLKSLSLWLLLLTTVVVLSEYYSVCHVRHTLALSGLLKYSGSKEIEYEWFSVGLEFGLKVRLMGNG